MILSIILLGKALVGFHATLTVFRAARTVSANPMREYQYLEEMLKNQVSKTHFEKHGRYARGGIMPSSSAQVVHVEVDEWRWAPADAY